MDTIEFRYCEYAVRDTIGHTLEIFVNDTSLVDLIGELERPAAASKGHPDLAGSYSGMHLGQISELAPDHFMGGESSHLECGPENKTVLLADKGCGEPGCWPLMARVEVADDTVTWTDFEQPHRENWNYGGFSLAFDRRQYEDALKSVESRPPWRQRPRAGWLGKAHRRKSQNRSNLEPNP
jgi:hypothetical protein